MAMTKIKKMKKYTSTICILTDSRGSNIPVKIKVLNGMILISPKGYGEMTAQDDDGTPIMIENHEGKIMVHLWSDINHEDPTHSVDMSNAQESLRNRSEIAQKCLD